MQSGNAPFQWDGKKSSYLLVLKSPVCENKHRTKDILPPGAPHLFWEWKQAGSKFVELLAEERFQEAVNTFDQTMTGLISPGKLGELWDQILEQSGTFQKQLSTRKETKLQYEIAFVTCQFDNGKLDVKHI